MQYIYEAKLVKGVKAAVLFRDVAGTEWLHEVPYLDLAGVCHMRNVCAVIRASFVLLDSVHLAMGDGNQFGVEFRLLKRIFKALDVRQRVLATEAQEMARFEARHDEVRKATVSWQTWLDAQGYKSCALDTVIATQRLAAQMRKCLVQHDTVLRSRGTVHGCDGGFKILRRVLRELAKRECALRRPYKPYTPTTPPVFNWTFPLRRLPAIA